MPYAYCLADVVEVEEASAACTQPPIALSGTIYSSCQRVIWRTRLSLPKTPRRPLNRPIVVENNTIFSDSVCHGK